VENAWRRWSAFSLEKPEGDVVENVRLARVSSAVSEVSMLKV
jgi:hypothetical protein